MMKIYAPPLHAREKNEEISRIDAKNGHLLYSRCPLSSRSIILGIHSLSFGGVAHRFSTDRGMGTQYLENLKAKIAQKWACHDVTNEKLINFECF